MVKNRDYLGEELNLEHRAIVKSESKDGEYGDNKEVYGELLKSYNKETKEVEFYILENETDNVVKVKEDTIGVETNFYDKNALKIYSKDKLKIEVELNKEFHGEYSLYEAMYYRGIWLANYLESEKGKVLPRGYVFIKLEDIYDNELESVMFRREGKFDVAKKEIEVVGRVYDLE